IETARRLGIRDASQLPRPEAFLEPARRRVALGLLVTHIVQTQELKVDRERVLARLNALVEAYPNPDEARRAYLQNAEAMRQIESAALEDQVGERVVERAKVTERPMSFSELTGFGRSAPDHDHAHHEHAHHEEAAGVSSEQQEAGST
ncbi:MAG: hypothetical protein JOZ34_01985, partial [Gammaproteobacteria bacterium]|nr:hypothetical protein [Gammaproteobacteria bacterium]